MARSQNPLTGKMSGTVGNFVTSSLGSQNIVRAKAFTTRDAKTEAQVKQRNGFKMIADLYFTLGGIPEEGFVQRSSETTTYAAFMAVNLAGAIDKSGSESIIDFTKLKVAVGTLSDPLVKSATLNAEGIEISYLPKLKDPRNLSTDEVVVLVLLKTGELWIERQPRGDVSPATLIIPVVDVTSDDIQGIYLFIKRADGTKVSKSVYLSVV